MRASAVGLTGPKSGSSVVTSVMEFWRGKRTGSLEDPSLSIGSDACDLDFLFPVYGVTGGDGRSISDCVRFRSAEMGGSFMSPMEESRGFANGEREAEKVSRGLVSGGDMRLETEGRRFIFGCLPEGQAAADEVISNEIPSDKSISR
jgi:hypothetical protein